LLRIGDSGGSYDLLAIRAPCSKESLDIVGQSGPDPKARLLVGGGVGLPHCLHEGGELFSLRTNTLSHTRSIAIYAYLVATSQINGRACHNLLRTTRLQVFWLQVASVDILLSVGVGVANRHAGAPCQLVRVQGLLLRRGVARIGGGLVLEVVVMRDALEG